MVVDPLLHPSHTQSWSCPIVSLKWRLSMPPASFRPRTAATGGSSLAPGVSAQFKMLSDRLHLHGRLRSKPVRSGRPGMHAPRYFRFLRARQLEWQMMILTPHACSRLVAFPRLQVS